MTDWTIMEWVWVILLIPAGIICIGGIIAAILELIRDVHRDFFSDNMPSDRWGDE